jgi:hypothetical protein
MSTFNSGDEERWFSLLDPKSRGWTFSFENSLEQDDEELMEDDALDEDKDDEETEDRDSDEWLVTYGEGDDDDE